MVDAIHAPVHLILVDLVRFLTTETRDVIVALWQQKWIDSKEMPDAVAHLLA